MPLQWAVSQSQPYDHIHVPSTYAFPWIFIFPWSSLFARILPVFQVSGHPPDSWHQDDQNWRNALYKNGYLGIYF